MTRLQDHPTVLAHRAKSPAQAVATIQAEELRALCLAAGADDVGFVAIDRSEIADQRAEIDAYFPPTKTLISFVCRMNREPIRSIARSTANTEFHRTGDFTNEVAHGIVRELEARGLRAVNPAMGFPMEMSQFPGKVWVVSHKPVAVAAGLGQMGIHRNVIHPRFGNFILLGTVLMEADISAQSQPIDYNPCLECKLCVAACPVGAIGADGSFNFSSCMTHNYREFMSGFTDWVEQVADARSAVDYRSRVTDSETASMWQSLSFGANYKAAYCLSVCPAGEEVIGPFLDDRTQFLSDYVKPLQQKVEDVYVQPRSDAEEHVAKRFPHKHIRHTGAVLRPTSIDGFIENAKHAFQPGQSKGLSATYHFRFTGPEPRSCTIAISNGVISSQAGLHGTCDLRVTVRGATWLRFLRKEANIVWLLATLQVRLRGNPNLLVAFGKCFP